MCSTTTASRRSRRVAASVVAIGQTYPATLAAVRLCAAVLLAVVAVVAAPAVTGTLAAGPPDPARAALTKAEAAKAITPEAAEDYRTVYGSARFQLERLDGLRKRELRSVIHITRDIARRGQLTS